MSLLAIWGEKPKNEREAVRYYTDSEVKFMIDNYPKMSVKQIAEKLGRTRTTVCTKIGRLKKQGLIKS